MEKLFEILGTAGGPTTVAGICLTLLFYLRRQEHGIRTDINGSLQRLTVEKESQQAELEDVKDQLEAKEQTIDLLRKERREAEDREDVQRRRADAAEARNRYLEERLESAEAIIRNMGTPNDTP